MQSNIEANEKPSNWMTARIQKSMNFVFKPISLLDLSTMISKGRTIRPSILETKYNQPSNLRFDFKSSQLIFLDFDSADVYTKENTINYLKINFGLNANLYYETFSSTKENPKYRLVILLDKPIKDKVVYDKVLYYLSENVIGADRKCKDAGRLYHGTNKGCEILYKTANSLDKLLEHIPLSTIELKDDSKVKTKSKSIKSNKNKIKSIKSKFSKDDYKDLDSIKDYVIKFSEDKLKKKLRIHFKSPVIYNNDLSMHEKYFITMFTSLAFYRRKSIKRELSYNELIAFLITFGYRNEKTARIFLNKLIKYSSNIINDIKDNKVIKIKEKFSYIKFNSIDDSDKTYFMNNVALMEFKLKSMQHYIILNESTNLIDIDLNENKILNIATQSCISKKVNCKQSTVARVISKSNLKTKDTYNKLYYWEKVNSDFANRKDAVTYIKDYVQAVDSNRRHTIYKEIDKGNTYSVFSLFGSSLIPKQLYKDNIKYISYVDKKGNRRNRRVKYSSIAKELCKVKNKPTYIQEMMSKNNKLILDNNQICLMTLYNNKAIELENIVVSNRLDLYESKPKPINIYSTIKDLPNILVDMCVNNYFNSEKDIEEHCLNVDMDINVFKDVYSLHRLSKTWFSIYKEVKQYNIEALSKYVYTDKQLNGLIVKNNLSKEMSIFNKFNSSNELIINRNLLIEFLSFKFIRIYNI